MISAKKLALIHLAKKRLKITGENFHLTLEKFGGVESSKDLDEAGFQRMMRYFASWGFRSDWTIRTYGKRPGMASPGQISAIRRLWHDWSGGDDENALNQWLERSFHVSALRFLTPPIAGKAINGLRAMVHRKQEPSAPGSSSPQKFCPLKGF